MKLPIVYEDNWILAINKPVGLPSLPRNSREQGGNNVMESIHEYCPHIAENFTSSGKIFCDGGILHRLDSKTSGVLLSAKNPKSYEIMMPIIRGKSHCCRKLYLAIVWGKISAKITSIDFPIAHLGRTKNMCCVDGRKRYPSIRGKPREAVTKIRKALYLSDANASLCLVEISRGQRHQIRCHLAHIGHPIIGDQQYSGRVNANNAIAKSEDLCLHCLAVEFPHPFLNRQLAIVTSIPEHFQLMIL